eukprot:GHUV01015697.1.p2 GENE.GHUV01015697.1~~GHUV01015697.1.p2  ORF type:complete len:133 (-),score=26.68 GHUV01015697.1:848-1246(-)
MNNNVFTAARTADPGLGFAELEVCNGDGKQHDCHTAWTPMSQCYLDLLIQCFTAQADIASTAAHLQQAYCYSASVAEWLLVRRGVQFVIVAAVLTLAHVYRGRCAASTRPQQQMCCNGCSHQRQQHENPAIA